MPKILLLGATGLLGQALLKEIKLRNLDVVGVARSKADISLDISDDNALISLITKNKFTVIINACAITDFKWCESNKGLAYLINARPSAILTDLAREVNARYIFISTDGYYSGDKDFKHKEDEDVLLLNEYVRTKFCGEKFTLTNPESLVLRTNIVGFRAWPHQPTMVEWVIKSLKENAEMTLFDDYFTSSISVSQFSKALCDLIDKKPSGIINLASSQVSSKAQFIQALAGEFHFGLKSTKVGSVSSLSGPGRAESLGLDITKAEKILGYHLPNLEEVIDQLKKDYDALG